MACGQRETAIITTRERKQMESWKTNALLKVAVKVVVRQQATGRIHGNKERKKYKRDNHHRWRSSYSSWKERIAMRIVNAKLSDGVWPPRAL